MPSAGTRATKSFRYSQVREKIVEQRKKAKQQLVELRKINHKEDRRHCRLMEGAGKFEAKDLMELAGIKHFILLNLAQYCVELGVDNGGVTVGGSSSSSGAIAPVVEATSLAEIPASDVAPSEKIPQDGDGSD